MSKFYWTFEIGIEQDWVADGFSPNEDTIQDSIRKHCLPLAYTEEVEVTLLESPDEEHIKEVQGFKERDENWIFKKLN